MSAFARFSSKPRAYLQIIPSSKGEVVMARPKSQVHPITLLVFLNAMRQENIEAYLVALADHRFGEAAFLEGGLKGIETVIHNRPPYEAWQATGEATLQEAVAQDDWSKANWWKGYVCGLSLAIKVEKTSWYKPTRYGDRLCDWFAQIRTETR